MRLGVLSVLCLCLAAPVHGQTGPMPTSEVTKDDFLIDLAGARIQFQFENVGQEFLDELRARDVGQLFSYEMPPADRLIADTNLIVTIFDGWAEARAYFFNEGLASLAETFPPPGDENRGGYVNVATVRSNEGHPVRFYTFMTRVNGVNQDVRCMARLVVDDTYVGNTSGSYDSTHCSDQIE